MKSLVAIGLLSLLLYHLIGLPLAVLTFEESYEAQTSVSPTDQWKVVKLPISLPYTSDWDNPDGRAGLIRIGDQFYNIVRQHYANDTLYTVLKTNQSARERFADLADQFQQVSSDHTPAKSPLSKALKLLKDRLTTYLLPDHWQLTVPVADTEPERLAFGETALTYSAAYLPHPSPPPRQ